MIGIYRHFPHLDVHLDPTCVFEVEVQERQAMWMSSKPKLGPRYRGKELEVYGQAWRSLEGEWCVRIGRVKYVESNREPSRIAYREAADLVQMVAKRVAETHPELLEAAHAERVAMDLAYCVGEILFAKKRVREYKGKLVRVLAEEGIDDLPTVSTSDVEVFA